MYNRYVPQGDGSFRRDWIPDKQPQQKPCPPKPGPPKQTPPKQDHASPPKQPQQRPPQASGNIAGFFRQLLPQDFCTEDLMIVLLLILMSGDCKEDQNTALLTLALYLFL